MISVHLLPVPEADPGEILITIDTAGAEPWDAEIPEAGPDGETMFPLILGTDGSRSVAALGEGIRDLALLFRERARQCEALGEFAMAEQIRGILVNKQDHQIDLATALGVEAPDLTGSAPT